MDHEWFGALIDQHWVLAIAAGGVGLLLGGRGKGWPGTGPYLAIAALAMAGVTASLYRGTAWPFGLAFIAGWLTMSAWLAVGALLGLAGGVSKR